MQALGNALNTALRSLEANQIGLAVASNNISNAQTPGYTRQRAILRPAEGSGGPFSIGGGVEVVGTEALRDRMIELRLREEVSGRAQDQMKHEGLSDIEMLFNEAANTGMLPLLTDFFNSFHALSTEPTSLNRRQEVTTNATKLTNFFNSRGNSLLDAQTKIDSSINEDVARANTLISEIASISGRIAETEVTHPAHELRDQRSVLLQRLSEIVDVNELETNNNYQVTIGSNRPLVYNGSAFHLDAATGSDGFTEVRLGVDNLTSEVAGGRLGARLELRDDNIPQYNRVLDQLAYEIAEQVNSIHAAGYDLDGNTGINFFTTMTSLDGAARSIAVDPGITGNSRRIAASDVSSDSGNSTAIELGNLLNSPVFTGGTIVEQYRGFIYTLGSDTANADLGMRQHEALVNQLENRRQEVSGVSIDEETVKIIQFQRAFEASARVVRAVDELLQLTLSLGQ
jgi:flagellar hook-associated protein 1 FlgK